jgi:hypothetical protein
MCLNSKTVEERTHIEGEETTSERVGGVRISSSTGCLITVFLGLLGAILLAQLFQFIIQGEKIFGAGDLEETRVWIVRQTDAGGFGFSRSRVISTDAGGDRVCVQTDIDFLLWNSDDSEPSVSYCECHQRNGSEWQSIGACEEVD